MNSNTSKNKDASLMSKTNILVTTASSPPPTKRIGLTSTTSAAPHQAPALLSSAANDLLHPYHQQSSSPDGGGGILCYPPRAGGRKQEEPPYSINFILSGSTHYAKPNFSSQTQPTAPLSSGEEEEWGHTKQQHDHDQQSRSYSNTNKDVLTKDTNLSCPLFMDRHFDNNKDHDEILNKEGDKNSFCQQNANTIREVGKQMNMRSPSDQKEEKGTIHSYPPGLLQNTTASTNRHLVTRYILSIFDELIVVPYDDIDRKEKRGISHKSNKNGFPGFACRHCLGRQGRMHQHDTRTNFHSNKPASLPSPPAPPAPVINRRSGRYFPKQFTTFKDNRFVLGIGSHLMKCENCPEPVKRNLERLSQDHHDFEHKVKCLKHRGGLTLFLKDIWRLLHPVKDDEQHSR